MGKGGHASRPHLTVDPIVVAASIVMSLQTVVSRNVDPTDTAVVTVGTIHGGTVTNVIPETAQLGLSVRSFLPGTRLLLEKRIREIVTSIAAAHGASVEIDYEHGYPVVTNSEEETAFATEVVKELVGDENVAICPMIPGSEDFCLFPGAQARLLPAPRQWQEFAASSTVRPTTSPTTASFPALRCGRVSRNVI